MALVDSGLVVYIACWCLEFHGYFADDVFKSILVNDKFCISIELSLKIVADGPIDNKPALLKIMAWHQIYDKPLSEPMLTRFTDAYMRHQAEMS